MCRFTKILACGLFLCGLIAFDRSSAEAEISNQASRAGATSPRTEEVKFSGLDESLKLFFGREFGLVIESSPGRGPRVSLTLPATKERPVGASR